MSRLVLAIVFSVAWVSVSAQQMNDRDILPGYADDDFREIVTDTSLFFAPLGDGTSTFSRLARYGFQMVSYSHRGADQRLARHYLGGTDVSTVMGRYPDYALYTALRQCATASRESFGMSGGEGAGLMSGTSSYDVEASFARGGRGVTMVYAQRLYTMALNMRSAGSLGRRWSYALNLRRRWGHDAFVTGVYSDALTASLAADKAFRDASHLSIFLLAAPSERGQRAYSVREAFELTGNNLYNPTWGYQSGRVRNSRISRDFTPLALVKYDLRPMGAVRGSLAVSWRLGERSRSGLSWPGAGNPTPDYYTNLPSYFADPALREEYEASWRAGDGRYTQTEWGELWSANLFADDGEGRYVVEDRAERINNLQAAANFRYDAPGGLRLDFGARVRRDGTRLFRRTRDMLGAEYILNIDQFLIGDAYYGDRIENDLRLPGRIVRRGERYGYDYDMLRTAGEVYGEAAYVHGRWRLNAAGSLTSSSLSRTGHYEKASFPGAASFGQSPSHRFTTYSLKFSARLDISPVQALSATVVSAEAEPDYENVFYSPDYHNASLASPRNIALTGAELSYDVRLGHAVSLDVAAYASHSAGESEIYMYYDDLYARTAPDGQGATTCVLEEVEKLSWGIEAGVAADITNRLRLLAGASVGSYVYAADPLVSTYSEVDMTPRTTGERSGMKGLISSQSPQTMAILSLSYNSPSRWRVELSASYADRRYVAPDAVRRTRRVQGAASSPEDAAALRAQERLPAASTVNLHISKGFDMFGGNLFATLSVSNLLDKGDTIYAGYEQSRSRLPSKYRYNYPRSALATLTYSF